MKLYHFTANRFLEGIQKDGLTKGHFPLLGSEGKTGFMKNTQWLTKRSGWDQAFHDAELTKLKYDRREVRLTIVIPKSRRKALFDKKTILLVFKDKLLEDFFSDDDCENWFIFYGRVKPQWIRDVVINPTFKNIPIA